MRSRILQLLVATAAIVAAVVLTTYFGSSPKGAAVTAEPVITSRLELVEVTPDGMVGRKIERMAYDSSSDALWLADVTSPASSSVLRYDTNGGTTVEYKVDSEGYSLNPDSGGMVSTVDGTIWLAFGNVISRADERTHRFVPISLPDAVGDNGDAAGIWGITSLDNDVWIARHQLKSLTVVSAANNSVRVVELPEALDYPHKLYAMPGNRLLITFGDGPEASGAAIFQIKNGRLTYLPGKWSHRLAIQGSNAVIPSPDKREIEKVAVDGVDVGREPLFSPNPIYFDPGIAADKSGAVWFMTSDKAKAAGKMYVSRSISDGSVQQVEVPLQKVRFPGGYNVNAPQITSMTSGAPDELWFIISNYGKLYRANQASK